MLKKSITIMIIISAGIVLFIAAADAMPVYYCKNGGIDLINDGCISGEARSYPGGGDGIYSNSGGGDPEAKVEQAILQATGSALDIMLYGKSDDNPTRFSFTPDSGSSLTVSMSGMWDVLDDTVFIKYLTIKASNSFALYELSPAANSGTYTTVGILNNGGNQPDVSHISFWTTEEQTDLTNGQTPIPEPGTMLLLGSGLLGAGLFGRRRFRK